MPRAVLDLKLDSRMSICYFPNILLAWRQANPSPGLICSTSSSTVAVAIAIMSALRHFPSAAKMRARFRGYPR